MEINLTFCIQIINFVIFYFCLRRFFLRPFVSFIQEKLAVRERILADFSKKEEQLKLLVHERAELSQQFKERLKSRHVLISYDCEQQFVNKSQAEPSQCSPEFLKLFT